MKLIQKKSLKNLCVQIQSEIKALVTVLAKYAVITGFYVNLRQITYNLHII
jgi:hypothetical protein